MTEQQTPSALPSPPRTIEISLLEARVLGTLMEKARTVPDSYPLSLNALVLGCNQKTSRDPLMDLTEADVAQALASLEERGLAHPSSGGRVVRYTHNFQRGVGVPEQSAVLLGLLMLRGPQTAAELRLNTERWYKFADVSSVEGFLDELQERAREKGGPLTIKLPRGPGAREARWAHLLCGTAAAQAAGGRGGTGMSDVSGTTADRLDRLEAEVLTLRATVQFLCDELGLSPPGQA